MVPCVQQPYCNDRLLPSEDGLCLPCGDVVGALPCATEPYCEGRLIAYVGDVALDTCEECGGESQPPCGDRARDQPCDEGLFRTTVTAEAGIRLRAQGQESYCSATQMAGQCGYIGQPTCSGDATPCLGPSTPSTDGQTCVECGAQGQGTCKGDDQTPCDRYLVSVQEGESPPVCICPEGSTDCTPDAASVDQSGAGAPISAEFGSSEPDCGQRGKVACTTQPFCTAPRTIPDENNRRALHSFVCRTSDFA